MWRTCQVLLYVLLARFCCKSYWGRVLVWLNAQLIGEVFLRSKRAHAPNSAHMVDTVNLHSMYGRSTFVGHRCRWGSAWWCIELLVSGLHVKAV